MKNVSFNSISSAMEVLKDLSKQIYQYIVKNPDVKAKVIANHFNVSRKFINHFLYKKTEYGLKDFVQKNQFDQWRIKDE